MKAQKIIAAFLSTALLGTQLSAYANSSELSVEIDRNSGKININGTANANEIVTIEILNPGKTEEDLDNSVTDASGLVTYFEEVNADSEGKYNIDFKIIGEDGKYPVRVYFVGEDKMYTDELLYITTDSVNNIIESINNNPANAEEIIEENKELLGFKNEIYNALTAENISLSDMYGKISDDAPFVDFTQLENSVTDKMLLEAFNKVNKASLSEILENNAEFIGIADEKFFEDYLALSEKEKQKVLGLLKNNGYDSMDDIKLDIAEKTIFCVLSGIKEWNNVVPKAESYFEEYKDIISELNDIDFDAYESLQSSYKQGAMKLLLNNASGNTSLEGWIDNFNDVCKEWKNGNPDSSNKNNSSNKGSSGGGGGGSSGGVTNVGLTVPKNTGKVEETEKVTEFEDLEQAAWAKESILELKNAGVVSGKSETIFDPNAGVKREEFVKMIVSAFGFTADGYESEFLDVEQDAWYYTYVSAAEKHGIAYGDDMGNFGIGKGITRQDMSVIIFRVLEKSGINADEINDKAVFADESEISDYAKEAVSKLQQYGIVNGMDNGTFAPKNGATRAQAARMIYGVMKLAGKI